MYERRYDLLKSKGFNFEVKVRLDFFDNKTEEFQFNINEFIYIDDKTKNKSYKKIIVKVKK